MRGCAENDQTVQGIHPREKSGKIKKNKISRSHVHIHLGEGYLDPFLRKPPGNPAVDGVLGFIGKVILPHPDFQGEVEARRGKLFEEDRGRRVFQEIIVYF